MKKVFLSHSSKDKEYVEHVVKRLGLDNCVYDTTSFEAGMPTLDEIIKGMDGSDIFVLFISSNSLLSPWVEKERNRAKYLLEEGDLLRFYPIIIDKQITYNDPRIPKWIREKYNIRTICSQKLAANKIKARLREVIWKRDPRIKRKNLLFIGRNEEVSEFEQRRSDFDRESLKCICASSAFSGIGRKAYMSHVLKKSNIMEQSYEYHLISLDKHESIEDFVLKIADLGAENVNVSELTQMSLDEKVSVASRIVREFQYHNEFVFINDAGVIVRHNSDMVEWFCRILRQIEPKMVFGIASMYKLHQRNCEDSVFGIQIPELSKKERRLMFRDCCDIESLSLSNDQMKQISDNLSGYPEQVFYAIQLIKDVGINSAIRQMHEIVSYATEKSQLILEQFVDSDDKMMFLAFLSSFDFVSDDILDSVYQEYPQYEQFLNEFISVSICEFLGSDGEYIRVNDILQDTISRQRVFMGDDLKKIFNRIVDCTVNDEFVNTTDLAQYYGVLRNKVENDGLDFNDKYIIPSHYIKCIVDHYNKRQYDLSSRLCKKLIEGDRIHDYDKELVDEIYYYYCQSLARNHKEEEFFKAIRYKGFKKSDRDFLKGFLYRINGNPQKAIEYLSRSLDSGKKFSKARRELANAYLYSENYEEAERLCEDNYRDDNKNPYFIHSYYESLIHQNITDGDYAEHVVERMQELLWAMSNSTFPQAKQMLSCMRAEYHAYVEQDLKRAMSAIDEGLSVAEGTNIYLLFTRFDIAYRNRDSLVMKYTLDEIERVVEKQVYFSNAMNIRRARYYHSVGDRINAISCLKCVNNMPKKTMQKIRDEIENET